MSLVCGLDVGSTSTKAVMLRYGKVESYKIIPTGYNMAISAKEVIDKLYGAAGIKAGDVARMVATGYGRQVVAFADGTATEITCHAKRDPRCNTGGQGSHRHRRSGQQGDSVGIRRQRARFYNERQVCGRNRQTAGKHLCRPAVGYF